jgi:hypothetical protein
MKKRYIEHKIEAFKTPILSPITNTIKVIMVRINRTINILILKVNTSGLITIGP